MALIQKTNFDRLLISEELLNMTFKWKFDWRFAALSKF